MRAGLAAGGLLAGVAAIALTSSGDSFDPEVISRSVDIARDAGTARALFTFTLDAPPGFEQQAVSFGGTTDFDFAADRSRSRFRFVGAVGGDGSSPDAPAEIEMELVAVGKEIYLRMPALRAAVPDAPSDWFTLDLGRLASVTGEPSLGLGATDPTQTLEYLRGASTTVDRIGSEPVGGVDATHYRAEVDLGRAVAMAPPSRRSVVSDAVEQFRTQFGTTRFPADVWIDARGLPRRLRFELDLADYDDSGEVPPGAIMSFTMELSDFGEPVRVKAPSPDLVSDLTTLLDDVRPSTDGAGS